MRPGPRTTLVALAILLASAAAAGCTQVDGSVGLQNPKLILFVRPDGDANVFVHAAAGERVYDRFVVRVDNETVAEDAHNYATLARFAGDAFRLDVTVESGDDRYVFAADFVLGATADTALVREVKANGADFNRISVPWSKIMAREDPRTLERNGEDDA